MNIHKQINSANYELTYDTADFLRSIVLFEGMEFEIYDEGMLLKMYGVYSCYFLAALESHILYIKCAFAS